MAESHLNCARCNARMEEGFNLELGNSNMRSVESWVAGRPEKGWMLGLKIKDRQKLPVRTFRCTACGYLESYAWPPDDNSMS